MTIIPVLFEFEIFLQYCELLNDSAKNKSAALVSIAASYADIRMFSDAIKYYEMEQELWAHEPKEEFRSRINLASIYERKDEPKNQFKQLNQAKSLAQLAESPSLQLEVLINLQNYYKANAEKGQEFIGENLWHSNVKTLK